MKFVPATVLADKLGIPRRTVTGWCAENPDFAVKQTVKRVGNSGNSKDVWMINVRKLAKSCGVDELWLELELRDPDTWWIKAIDLSRLGNLPRKTVANWYSQLGIRLGQNTYVSSNSLAPYMSELQLVELRRLTGPKGVSENG